MESQITFVEIPREEYQAMKKDIQTLTLGNQEMKETIRALTRENQELKKTSQAPTNEIQEFKCIIS